MVDRDLAWFVEAVGEEVAFAADCKAQAEELVTRFIGSPDAVPEPVKERAVLEVGADLFYRKQSRNGVVGFDGPDALPFRLNRDPMAAAYPLLRPYIQSGL